MSKVFLNGVLFLALIVFFSACQSDGATSGNSKMTESGYSFDVITDTPGPSPQLDEFAFFDLTVTSNDSLIQSSHQQDQPFTVKITDDKKIYGAFAPVIDMIRTMSVGDSSVLYFPRDSFANAGAGMENFADIIQYEVVLKEIQSSDKFKIFQDSVNAIKMAEGDALRGREAEVKTFLDGVYTDYKAGKLASDIQTTESGLKYIVHEVGNTDNPVDKGNYVNVLYYGTLEKDNSEFDNAFKRGAPFGLSVGAGSVIRGWDEGLQLLNYGSKATFIIPSELGYGETGSPPNIGPGDDLIFYVELMEE